MKIIYLLFFAVVTNSLLLATSTHATNYPIANDNDLLTRLQRQNIYFDRG
jgi:cell division protein FtsL